MTLDTAQHKQILMGLLKDIYLTPYFGSRLGLGGYGCYALLRTSPFSVDLDFDLLDHQGEDELFERFKSMLGSYGIIKDAMKKRNGLYFLGLYHNLFMRIEYKGGN